MDYQFPVTRTPHPKPRPEDENQMGFARYFTDHMFVADYDEGQGWHDARIVPNEPFLIDPASCVLHYAQMSFEGMKAFSCSARIVILPECGIPMSGCVFRQFRRNSSWLR